MPDNYAGQSWRSPALSGVGVSPPFLFFSFFYLLVFAHLCCHVLSCPVMYKRMSEEVMVLVACWYPIHSSFRSGLGSWKYAPYQSPSPHYATKKRVGSAQRRQRKMRLTEMIVSGLIRIDLTYSRGHTNADSFRTKDQQPWRNGKPWLLPEWV